MIKKFLLIAVVLLVQGLSYGQKKYSEMTKEEYLEDFDALVDIVKKQHPNPYRFISEKEFDNQVNQSRKRIEKEPTFANFLLESPIKLIRDAHSGISPDGIFFQDFTKSIRFFPIETAVFNNKVYVNQYTNEIPAGAQIIKVNNITVDKILERVPRKADGNSEASSQMEFSIYTSLMNPDTKEYKIEYKENDSDTSTKLVTLPSVDYYRYHYNSTKTILPVDLIGYNSGIYSRKINDDTAIVEIRTFDLSEEYAYYILSKIFEQFKADGIKNLIFDIRGNGGGALSNIPLYYSFITKDKIFKNNYRYGTKVIEIQEKKNLVDGSGRLATYTDVATMNNFMAQRFDKNEEDGYYYGNTRLDESYVENYPQDRNAFTGNVILLIDNNTVSAAAYFANLFRDNNRGLIVGQETRSCSNFTTAAWFLNYKLPNTETIVDLPRSEVFFNNHVNAEKECRGVIPDYYISNKDFQQSLKDVEDAELNLALKLIENNQK